MPSPFPGMDPFLEAPVFFHGLHTSLIAYLREALQPLLPEPYYAELEERTWIEMSSRHVEPDVNVLRAEQPTPARASGIAVAQAVTAAPMVVVTVPHSESRETFLN